MLYAVELDSVFEVEVALSLLRVYPHRCHSRSELCTVITHELLWNAISSKHITKLVIVASLAMLGIISTSNHFE